MSPRERRVRVYFFIFYPIRGNLSILFPQTGVKKSLFFVTAAPERAERLFALRRDAETLTRFADRAVVRDGIERAFR